MTLPAKGLARFPPVVQWALLSAGSALFALGLRTAGLPAALFLGPMVAAILVGINGGTVRVPRLPYFAAQGFMGCLIATAITPEIVASFARQWPLFLGVVLAVIMASSLLGWLISRWQVLPGTAGVWGSWPGAATAMVVMADAFGADARLVAFMQYFRVVCVATVASLVAHFWIGGSGASAPPVSWFPPFQWLAFGETVALAAFGAYAGRMLKLPSGAMLVPMLVGAVLHSTRLIEIQLPTWLLAMTYALLGWNIGLVFTRQVLVHVSRAFLKVFLSIAILIAFCGALAGVLARAAGIDPLTAYLATSPGGMDSVAIIAAGSKVDLSFVMALQTIRFFIIVLIGPPLARFVANRMG